MPLYRTILAQAWKITWRYKYLWFFGLFAALLGNGGELEFVLQGVNGSAVQQPLSGVTNFFATGIFSRQAFVNMGKLFTTDPVSLLIALLVLVVTLLLWAFLVWLVVVSEGALVNNSARSISAKQHDFKGGMEMGMKKFWPVLGLNVIVKILVYILFLVLGLPILASNITGNPGAGNMLFLVMFIIFIPVIIFAAFIIKYSIAYVIIKGNRFLDAIAAGWRLFWKNWLVSIEMSLILFFINFLVGLCLLILLLVLSIPLLFLALIFIKSALLLNFWITVIFGLVLFLLLIAAVGSGLATYQISSWTGLFVELISRGGTSKIVRVLEKK